MITPRKLSKKPVGPFAGPPPSSHLLFLVWAVDAKLITLEVVPMAAHYVVSVAWTIDLSRTTVEMEESADFNAVLLSTALMGAMRYVFWSARDMYLEEMLGNSDLTRRDGDKLKKWASRVGLDFDE